MRNLMLVACLVPMTALAEPPAGLRLDDLNLDRITAGQPTAGILLQAASGTDIRAGNPEIQSAIDEQPLDDFFNKFDPSDNHAYGAAYMHFVPPDLVTTVGILQISGGDQSQSASASNSFDATGSPPRGTMTASAETESGSAEGTVRVTGLPSNPLLALTLAKGHGQTTGDGDLDISGIALHGAGVGTGVVLPSPRGDRVLLIGIAGALGTP